MVELNTLQLGEVVFLISGTKSVVDGGRPEDGSHPNNTSNELIVLASDGGQDSRVESGHEVGKGERGGYQALKDRMNIYPQPSGTVEEKVTGSSVMFDQISRIKYTTS